ncbi:MAG: hypothetical protein ACJ72D_09620 [Marmoricola sp.]
MTHVKELLDLASEGTRSSVDPAADLARAQRASRARTAKRLQLGSVGLALVAILGVGIGQVVTDSTTKGGTSAGPDVKTVSLVTQPFDADPYTFDLTPEGWHVQGHRADHVTIAPDDGTTSDSPDVFVGKLVILFDQNPPSGERVLYDGRVFWIGGDGGSVTVSTNTRGEEPPGMVRVQYPTKAGWTRATMLKFLGSVHVGPGALPGLG